MLIEPVLPFSAARLRAMLRLDGVRASTPGGDPEAAIGWDEAGQPLLQEKNPLGGAEILFNKVEDTAIEEQIAKLKASEAASDGAEPEAPYEPKKDLIEYDDFAKLDLRMGTVTAAERVPKSKKLLRMDVDLGFEQRQILAGAAQQLDPDDLIGRRVVVVANLTPRKLFGLESQGMLLMSEDRDGRLCPVTADGEDGAVVR